MAEMQAPTAVVTGAAGFIGSHLSERLVAGGWRVAGIDDERTGSWSQVSPQVRRIEHDLTKLSEAEMRKLLDGSEVLFHLAAEKHMHSLDAPKRVLDVNVAATSRLFRAAADADVGKVVFTSSLYAYGSLGPEPMHETDLPTPNTTYGVSKLAGEHLLRVAERHACLPWTTARLFFIYGPRQHARSGYRSVIHANFERILHGEPPTIFGDGLQALDYMYIDDCVDALVMLASHQHDGLMVNLSSGRAVSVAELTGIMLETASSSSSPVYVPPDWTAGTIRAGSTALSRERLGWETTTTLRDGLSRVWSWLRSTST